MTAALYSPAVAFALNSACLGEVLAERERQIRAGYDPRHDDAHSDGRMAFEAAAAIMPLGSSLDAPLWTDGWNREPTWIDTAGDKSRRTCLVQGIALALAELERMTRAAVAADLENRTHGADSAIDDELEVQIAKVRDGAATYAAICRVGQATATIRITADPSPPDPDVCCDCGAIMPEPGA